MDVAHPGDWREVCGYSSTVHYFKPMTLGSYSWVYMLTLGFDRLWDPLGFPSVQTQKIGINVQ